jgi:hypothetical protein
MNTKAKYSVFFIIVSCITMSCHEKSPSSITKEIPVQQEQKDVSQSQKIIDLPKNIEITVSEKPKSSEIITPKISNIKKVTEKKQTISATFSKQKQGANSQIPIQIIASEVSNIQSKIEEKANKNSTVVLQKQDSTQEISNYEGITFEKLADKMPQTVQIFEVLSSKDTILICDGGTKLHIKANSFFIPNTISSATEKIQIAVKEFYTLEDMVFANLNTISENKMLESGGMLFVDATVAGKSLELQKDKNIKIEMPIAQKPKKDMQVFYSNAQSKGSNWEQADKKSTVSVKKVTPQKIQADYFYMPFFEEIYTKQMQSSSVCLRKKKEVTSRTSVLIKNNWLDTITISCLVNKQGNIKKAKLISGTEFFGNARVSIFGENKYLFGIGSSYRNDLRTNNYKKYHISVKNLKYKYKAQPFYIKRNEIKQLLEQVAPFDDTMEILIKKVYYNYNWLCNNLMSNNPVVDKGASEADIKKIYANNTASAIDLGNYVLIVNQLGWINVDRFSDSKIDKIDFVVNAGMDTDIKIIFPDFNSVMGTSKMEERITQKIFSKMPKDERIVIVAIRMVENKPELALLRTKISKRFDEELVFHKVNSLEELKTSLAALLADENNEVVKR